MEKSVKITLIIVSAVIFLVLFGAYTLFQISPTKTVTANGQATIKAIPDLVIVYFNVQTEGKTAQEAKDSNAKIVDNAITLLVKERFNREDIVTENFNVYPLYDWKNGQNTIKGYQATHSLKLEIPTEDSDKIGEAIDAGVNAGALISYINFELSQENQNKYKAEALQKAAEDAKLKAEAIALGLDKKLGGIVSTSSSDFNYYPWRLYESAGTADVAMAKQAVTDIQPGNQEISASISVTYKLR